MYGQWGEKGVGVDCGVMLLGQDLCSRNTLTPHKLNPSCGSTF